jgi:hypothetical protein
MTVIAAQNQDVWNAEDDEDFEGADGTLFVLAKRSSQEHLHACGYVHTVHEDFDVFDEDFNDSEQEDDEVHDDAVSLVDAIPRRCHRWFNFSRRRRELIGGALSQEKRFAYLEL